MKVGNSEQVHQSEVNISRKGIYVHLWVIGEGNGNPLQYSCLENPRDGGAWWGHTESDMTEAT